MSDEKDTTRVETDTMGKVEIPGWAYWGAQTQRAVENFSVSDKRIPVSMIQALGLIKRFAAEANRELGLLDKKLAHAICQAAEHDARPGAHPLAIQARDLQPDRGGADG